jgi:hypothetical protein
MLRGHGQKLRQATHDRASPFRSWLVHSDVGEQQSVCSLCEMINIYEEVAFEVTVTSERASERPVSAHRGAMTRADLPAPLESAAVSSSLHPVTQRRLRLASG